MNIIQLVANSLQVGNTEEYYKPHGIPAIVNRLRSNIYKQFVGEYQGYKIFLVDGFFIRKKIYTGFIGGGNFARDMIVPDQEIWVEYFMDYRDRIYTMLHEFLETKKMIHDKQSYDKAHSYANTLEQIMRNDKDFVFTYNTMKDFISMYQQLIQRARDFVVHVRNLRKLI